MDFKNRSPARTRAETRAETINLRATLVPRLTPRKYENAIAGAVETRVRSSTYSLALTHLLGNSKGQAESGSASVEAPKRKFTATFLRETETANSRLFPSSR
jgi:hypothetical protein